MQFQLLMDNCAASSFQHTTNILSISAALAQPVSSMTKSYQRTWCVQLPNDGTYKQAKSSQFMGIFAASYTSTQSLMANNKLETKRKVHMHKDYGSVSNSLNSLNTYCTTTVSQCTSGNEPLMDTVRCTLQCLQCSGASRLGRSVNRTEWCQQMVSEHHTSAQVSALKRMGKLCWPENTPSLSISRHNKNLRKLLLVGQARQYLDVPPNSSEQLCLI